MRVTHQIKKKFDYIKKARIIIFTFVIDQLKPRKYLNVLISIKIIRKRQYHFFNKRINAFLIW